jgi:hypothetical protein
MKKRSILLMIIFTIFTAGIYMLYWYIAFQVELKRETGKGFGGFGHFLMMILTFGIYAIYWQYAAGKRLADQGASDLSLIYLIFCFVALSWLNPFIMQSQANGLK